MFIDSWVWLEYLFSGESEEAAGRVIERASTAGESALIAPTVITEVSYRIQVVADEATAEEAIRAIHDIDGLECLPLVSAVAEFAAALRHKYYESGTREFSYADTIHLATAAVHDGCDVLYSGDPDFASVDEIETVVL